MTYYNEKLSLISDSNNNIDLFRLVDGEIVQYHFNYNKQSFSEKMVAKEVFLEYDASIDKEDYIYLIYQDMSFNLIMTLLKNDKLETIRLTGEPLPEIYYLNIIIDDKEPHIFYFVLLSEKKYRMYHHYFNGIDWITNTIDEIVVDLLNPMGIFKRDKEVICAYYNNIEEQDIYMRIFDLQKKEWGEKSRLTNNGEKKLYLDILIKDLNLHITYCQYDEGNLVVKYERLIYEDGKIEREIEVTLSNPENPQHPTLIYYEDKLWISWIEYDNVMSRYSEDMGSSWSPIYMWQESKKNDIVRYKYSKVSEEKDILNHSFGKINPDISFIGFGPTENTIEIALKKKAPLIFPKTPRI